MAENGELPKKESDNNRDKNGRFSPGNNGGPGRGKTKSRQELSEAIEEIKSLLQDNDANLTSSKALAPVGRVLLHGITSPDSKVRTDSAKLYFVWLPKMNEAEEREKGEDNLPSLYLNVLERIAILLVRHA